MGRRAGGARAFALVAALAAALALLLSAVPMRAASAAPVTSRKGMVVSPQSDATRAGVAILRAGGNAVDAAVATAFALGVTDGYHSGIGGGGFILIHLAGGRTVAIDARETAPAAATRDMYVRPGAPKYASRIGALSIGTPGLLRGLALAEARYGKLSLRRVMAPAIRLAERGFAVGPLHAELIRFWQAHGLAKRFPATARMQLPKSGKPIHAGWRLVQKDLARTLRRISRVGPDDFYRGKLAHAIVAEVQRRGGILSLADLAHYRAIERKPVEGEYRGTQVFSFPPPSSGGIVLVEMLNILEPYDLASRGAGSSASDHLIAEAMKLAFADRAAYLGDSDFVKVPQAELVSKAYAARLRRRIDPPWYRRPPWTWGCGERAIRVTGPGLPSDDHGTTHLSVTDAAGNAVAITQTINLILGSGITVPGTGIVLNDEMDDFSVAPDTPNAFGLVDTRGQNAIAPGKRPLSSMSPTILLKNGKVFMVTGSPGGPRIITTTLLTILNVVNYGMDVEAAVAAPRIHDQWIPRRLLVEPEVPADVVEGLRRRGHHVVVAKRDWSSAQAIVVDPKTGLQMGGSDPRSDGLAEGP